MTDTPTEIILASGSPRRRELLGAMGVAFEVVTAPTPELDGDSAPHLSPVALAVENARLKAEAVAKLRPGRWVLGADTVVALDGRIFGKPASRGDAAIFLRTLSGRTHEVITGCALLSPAGAAELFHEITRVTFLELTGETIVRYLDAVEVLDKAGAYALQQHGEWIIASVKGSRSNVVGLPTEALEKILLRHGLIRS
jgi:septum formation protein